MENISYYASKIFKYMNTGEEYCVNGSLYFGMGDVYVYVQDLNDAGMPYELRSNELFGALELEYLTPFLEFLYKRDGYIQINLVKLNCNDY